MYDCVGIAFNISSLVDANDGQIGIANLENLVERRGASYDRLRQREAQRTSNGASQKSDTETVSPCLGGGGYP